MARPERNNVDYFPFLCKEGKAMFYIEQKYGNDGYAVWVKILRQLAVTNFHYLNLSDQAEFMFLSSKCRVSELMLENIINDLCKLGEFHAELWTDYRIIFNEKFVSSIGDAYAKRNSKCITLPGLFSLLLDLGIRKLPLTDEKYDNNPQSKVKEIKEEKKKEEEGNSASTIFTPPILLDVENYFFEKAVDWPLEKVSFEAKKFMALYESNGWKVGKNKMQKWKSAAAGWILRDEEFKAKNNGNTNDKPERKFGRLSESSIRNVFNRPDLPLPD